MSWARASPSRCNIWSNTTPPWNTMDFKVWVIALYVGGRLTHSECPFVRDEKCLMWPFSCLRQRGPAVGPRMSPYGNVTMKGFGISQPSYVTSVAYTSRVLWTLASRLLWVNDKGHGEGILMPDGLDMTPGTFILLMLFYQLKCIPII